jgi:tetratricopeptide (TPR) repeat protein
MSKSSLGALCGAVLLCLASASAAAAQDWKGSARVQGKVTDPDGKPIEGALVKLELPQAGGTELKTNKKGEWAILGLASGEWHIDVSAQGYEPKAISVSLAYESRTKPIEVKLERAKPKGPPPEVVAALEKAEKAYKEGRFDEARAEYEKLLALRPDLAGQIHQQIGFAYVQQKQYAQAVEHLEKAIAAAPDRPELKVIAAQAALEGGMLDKGRELLAQADPALLTNPDQLFNIAVAFLNGGATEEAITYLTKAVTADPAYVDGYYRRALAYLGLGKMEESKADLKKVIELDPTGPQGEAAKKALAQIK